MLRMPTRNLQYIAHLKPYVILEEILHQIEEPRHQNQYKGVEQYNQIIFQRWSLYKYKTCTETDYVNNETTTELSYLLRAATTKNKSGQGYVSWNRLSFNRTLSLYVTMYMMHHITSSQITVKKMSVKKL